MFIGVTGSQMITIGEPIIGREIKSAHRIGHILSRAMRRIIIEIYHISGLNWIGGKIHLSCFLSRQRLPLPANQLWINAWRHVQTAVL